MRTLKVKITSSVSAKLRDKRVEIDEEYRLSVKCPEFKEGSVEVETQDAYLIVPKNRDFKAGLWVAKNDIEVLAEIKNTLDRWV